LRLDALRLALQAVAALSASRLSNLMDPDVTGLRRFLAVGPDGSSGAMLLEYVAQDALATVRTQAQPATLGSVSLSQGLESHASLAPHAVTTTADLLGGVRRVLACELVAAGRAATLAALTSSAWRSAPIGGYLADVADALPADLEDRPLSADLAAAEALLTRWGAG
jgi:histidine ammonia-lyase